jgi:hypothetical protein
LLKIVSSDVNLNGFPSSKSTSNTEGPAIKFDFSYLLFLLESTDLNESIDDVFEEAACFILYFIIIKQAASSNTSSIDSLRSVDSNKNNK